MNNAVNVSKWQALVEEARSASKADQHAELHRPAEEQEVGALARYATELAADKAPPCVC